ncbi:TonB-dependent receptor [Steroidobacter cummioxidans]|uniref:TonB-dependent receptor n=1 Tax=Steroidobacter cummioxidans TaxID=1803913 RepID=UPI000E312F8E|nr:TonB-dependent receptor [Steroidobacter cummioxidans]
MAVKVTFTGARRWASAWQIPFILGFTPAGFAANAAEEGRQAGALEEVVVTARKREESLQDTPIAISAFSAAALQRQQISSTEDLDQIAPNLQFASYGPLTGNNSAAQVYIRGIGQSDGSSGVDPGVGLYIDDVYMGRSVGGVLDFRDVANVQILRGPQGTLFGRNTIGGAVLLTTTLPGKEFGGTARVGLGDDNLYEGFVAVDLPIADSLAARVSVGARQRDGYVTRVYDGLDLGNEDTYTFQSSLQWQPSDSLSLTLRGDYTKEDEHGSPFVFATINGTQAFPAAISRGSGCPGATFPPPSVPQNIVDPRCANDATWDLGKYRNGGNAPAASTLENWGVSGTLRWELTDRFALKSITAYRELDWSGSRDADNTGLLVLHTDYSSAGDQFSQELQALIETDRLRGVVGAFYFEESIDDFLLVPFAAPPPLVASGAVPGSLDYQRAFIQNDNLALFTQWTYNVTDALSLTAGVRYTEETKGIQIISFTVTPLTAPVVIPGTMNTPLVAGPGLNIIPRHFENKYESTTGSASIQYRWNPSLMTYLSWSQGFKSGGFNQRYNLAPPGNLPVAFDEETAETFELGFKSELGANLRLNGAIFSTDYDNMQLTYRLGIVPLLFNAGKSSIEGGELELTYAPGRLLVEASASYLHNKFDEIAVVPGTTQTVGPNNTLPFAPEWQASLGVGYDFEVGNATLTPRINLSYTSEQFFDAANSVEVAQLDDVTLVNASLTLELGAWRLRAGVNNATDEQYRVAGNSSFATSAGYAEVIYSRPRNYFLSASVDF